MTKKSYSRVECFKQCPYKYKLKYVDEIKTLPNYDADNALHIGTMLHKAIETDVDTAVKEYYDLFPIITDAHINEAMKVEELAPKVKWLLPDGQNEVELNCEDFIGFIDLLAGDSLFDFKYSNNIDRYLESGQLHVYKYYAEKLLGVEIKYLYYVFVPKVAIRQKKTETIEQFRQRLRSELSEKQPKLICVEFDQTKVDEFLAVDLDVDEFPKCESRLCSWCEYEGFCKRGETYDIV